jgi:hypothetical protein
MSVNHLVVAVAVLSVGSMSHGGLTAQALRVLRPTAEYLTDIVGRSQAAGSGARPGVFLVIPYVFSPTPLEEYLRYAHGYTRISTRCRIARRWWRRPERS